MLSLTEAKKYPKYAEFLRPCKHIVDLGCGPGAFLGFLKERGQEGLGVDDHTGSLRLVRAAGLRAVKSDALGFLKRAKAGSFDGVFCSNLLEHLDQLQVKSLLDLCAKKMPRGGRLALATANPRCLGLVAGDFWEDIQHVRFYPPRLLKAELEARGFRVQWAGADEDTRVQGLARSLLRKFRGLFIGDYFGPPEIGVMAIKD